MQPIEGEERWEEQGPPKHPLVTEDLDVVLSRPRARGRWLAQGGIAALVVLAGMIALVVPVIAPPHSSASHDQGQTVPFTVGVTFDVAQVVIETNVNWGKITLNGAPVVYVPHFYNVVAPVIGHNTLTIDAPPFLPRTCSFDWPPALQRGTGGSIVPAPAPSGCLSGSVVTIDNLEVAAISLGFSPGDLPLASRAGVMKSIDDALAGYNRAPAATTLLPGDLIPIDYDQRGVASVAVATETTTASLDLALAPPGVGGSCAPLCAAALAQETDGTNGTHSWWVSAWLSASWSFSAPEQPTTTLAVPQPAGGDDIRATIRLDAAPNGDWQVPSGAGGFDATIGSQMVSMLCNGAASQLLRLSSAIKWVSVTTASIDGCTIAASTQPDATTGDVNASLDPNMQNPSSAISFAKPPANSLGTFIYRAGVLTAVDAAAHAMLPEMPVVPPSGQGAGG